MESMIRDIVQSELKKCMPSGSSSSANKDTSTSSTQANLSKSSKVQTRLTNLLTNIRGKGDEKKKQIKLQVNLTFLLL